MLKFPDDIRLILRRRYQSQYRNWLVKGLEDWPIEIPLGVPTENKAQQQTDNIQAWVSAWRTWQGKGEIVWCERHWRLFGTQRLPERLIFQRPVDIAAWLGKEKYWQQAQARYQALSTRWPVLTSYLPRYFDVLATYDTSDFQRLVDLLDWIIKNPCSHLYPRQLPIAGLDTKWLEKRMMLVAELVAVLRNNTATILNFFQCCGLKQPPPMLRFRVLDQALRNYTGGLSDITAPVTEIVALDLPVSRVYIVENLQSGLAFEDLVGAVVFMGLGNNIDNLGRVPWLAHADIIYWGDLDTYGFAILSRARACLPKLRSILMDEETLFRYQVLWGTEKVQYLAPELPWLTDTEQAVYRGLKQQQWGYNVRLEQERIAWEHVMSYL